MGMKPRSKGRPKSKRVTLKDKYKIQRKVKEHNRKKRKEERLKGKSKLKKDPGVPAMHPFRKEIIEEIKAAKEKDAQERKDMFHAALERKARERQSLEDMQREAEARGRQYETAQDMEKHEAKKDLKDSSRRAFFKEFASVIEEADVILQVLDARDPIASRSSLVENAILECRGKKKLVLVLNKIDLVPRSAVEKWLTYFRNEFPTVAFKASTQSQKDHLSQSGSQSAAKGADTLMQLLRNYCRNLNIKTSISVGVVGYPNVGKSSIINSLKRKRAAHVGQMPGITRQAQRIMLEKHIALLDSPGIVFSSQSDLSSLVLRNCVRSEALADPVAVVDKLVQRCDTSQILEFYGLRACKNAREFLQLLAKRLGKLKKGGVPNIDAAANQVLHDFHTGRISYFVQPPEAYKPENDLGAEIVSEWGAAFELDGIYGQNDELVGALKDKKDMKKSQRFEFFPSERLVDDIASFQLSAEEEGDGGMEEGDDDDDDEMEP